MRKRICFSLLIAALLVLAVCGAQAWGDPGYMKKVNCTKGETITHALQESDGNPITIQVKGTCNENIDIVRDDVTLIAHPSGGTVNGPDPSKNTILVRAGRVTIDGLTVTGGRSGIFVSGGGATIRNCTVRNTGYNGISFYQGGKGTVDDCTVQDNGHHGILIEAASATVINSTISSNAGVGIMVSRSGAAKIGINGGGANDGNTISYNGGSGINIYAGGSAFIGGNTIDGNGTDPSSLHGRSGILVDSATAILVGSNIITNNKRNGVFAISSTVRIGQAGFPVPIENVISGNGETATSFPNGGIVGFFGSSLDIRYATINGNNGHGVALNLRSTAIMIGDTVNNNTGNGILLVSGGGLSLGNPAVTVTGNTLYGLNCGGDESSYSGDISGISGNGNDGAQNVGPDCTGF